MYSIDAAKRFNCWGGAKTAAGLRNTNARHSRSTQAHIQRYSPVVSQQFLRPFFSSVFLDPQVQAPADLFQYYLALFARGGVAVPSHGMGVITQRLAAQAIGVS